MPIYTVSSRDFTRNSGNAKPLATEGLAFIRDRGKKELSLLELMDGMPRTEGIEFDAPLDLWKAEPT